MSHVVHQILPTVALRTHALKQTNRQTDRQTDTRAALCWRRRCNRPFGTVSLFQYYNQVPLFGPDRPAPLATACPGVEPHARKETRTHAHTHRMAVWTMCWESRRHTWGNCASCCMPLYRKITSSGDPIYLQALLTRNRVGSFVA